MAEAQTESTERKEFAFLGEMCSVEKDKWNEILQLNGEMSVFKLDTDEFVTAIPSGMYSWEKLGLLQMPEKVLLGPSKQRLETRGCFIGELHIEKNMTKPNIYDVVALSRPLLGLPAIKALKLIRRVHEIESQNEDFNGQCPTVFCRFGGTEKALQH